MQGTVIPAAARFDAARERAKQQARLADAFRAISAAMSGPDDVRINLERGRGGGE